MDEASRNEHELQAIRPGIAARTHRVEGGGEWGELEIRGVVVSDLALPAIPTFDAREHVPVADALAALADFRARGVRVLLVRIHCAGGTSDAGIAIEEAFRAYSAGGGTLITYVDRVASSSASAFALCADVVAMAPHATFAVHRALGFKVPTLEPRPADDPDLEAINQHMLAVYREHTFTPREDLALWVHLGPNDRGEPTHAELDADAALAHGWVDAVVPREDVEDLVRAALADCIPVTPRSRALAERRSTPATMAVCTLQTSNYAEDVSGNPTAGARLDHTGTALKVAPGNFQIGSKTFSGMWLDGSDYAFCHVWCNGDSTFTLQSWRNIVTVTRVASLPGAPSWPGLKLTLATGWMPATWTTHFYSAQTTPIVAVTSGPGSHSGGTEQLSVHAYDTDAVYFVITRQLDGTLRDPATSLGAWVVTLARFKNA